MEKTAKRVVMEPRGKKPREENKQRLIEFFNNRLEKTINKNQDRKNPYFITYKIRFDRQQPWVAKDLMYVHDVVPETMVAGTLLFKIDNEKGSCDLLRVIDP